MAKHRVVVTDLGYPTYKYEEEQLKPVGAELVLTNCRTEDEVAAAIRDADGVIVRLAPCTAKAINATTRCKVIARYGVGVDNVDLAAATAKGICVANVPDYCWDEVSEHALALIFSCARKTVRHDRLVRKGEWDIGSRDPIYRMAGKTLGLLGFGNIARSLARKAQGLRFRILAHDPFVKPEVAQELGATLVDMDTLLRESDYLSVHAPNTPQTRHLVNEAALRKMKRTAILVNTSRGPLVDEAALARALKEGWINSAGLDVYEKEPLPADSPLRQLDNIVLTGHAAWYSEEAGVELQTKAAAEVARVLAGGWPKSLVNPQVRTAAR